MVNRDGDPILYICYQEEHAVRCCYTIRAINLVDLLSCSCKFDEDSREIIQCNRCKSRRRESGDSDPSGDLRVLAHLCGSRREVPNSMGCGVFGSQIIFLGGLEPPPLYPVTPQLVHSKRVFVFETAGDGSKSIQKMDESSNLTKFLHGKVNPWLVELNGDLYAFSFSSIPYPTIRRSEANPTILRSEVYRRGSQQWETLPKPLQPQFFSDIGRTYFSCAITCGDKVLVSKRCPSGPILCFDPQVNSWKPSPCCSEPFPFSGEGLVLDWKDCGGRNCNDKVMFSLYRDSDILVRRLVLSNEDDLDAAGSSMEEVEFLGITSLMASLMLTRRKGYSSHKFVHIGDGKVCFVKAKGFHYSEQSIQIETVRLLFVIFKFQFDDSGAFSSKILATRTFDYETHCDGSYYPRLISCFVR